MVPRQLEQDVAVGSDMSDEDGNSEPSASESGINAARGINSRRHDLNGSELSDCSDMSKSKTLPKQSRHGARDKINPIQSSAVLVGDLNFAHHTCSTDYIRLHREVRLRLRLLHHENHFTAHLAAVIEEACHCFCSLN